MGFQFNRSDLSDWVIHFVHDRNITCHPNDIARERSLEDLPVYPERFDLFGNFDMEDGISHADDRMPLCDDEPAFVVLKKIIYSGFIKSGWSFRNHRATIYGPKQTVCFTEMPLNNLHDYFAQRNNKEYVNCYGIAFKKEELFALGGRPVIYGLSGEHKEAEKAGDPDFGIGLRTLQPSCGIGLLEQY